MSTSNLSKRLLPAAIVVVAVLVFVALLALRPKPQRQRPPTPRAVVTALTVAPGTEPIRVRGFGEVRAKRSITLVPQVSGEVVEKALAFEAGGTVDGGQMLLRIDDTDYALAVAQARANLAQAEVNLALAEEEALVAIGEWERLHAAAEPAPPLVRREPQLNLARANLEAARSALRQAEVNLGRCTLSAPFTGRVLSSDVDRGQYLRSGSAVGSLYATDIAEVTVSIADADLAWIALRDSGCPAGPATGVTIEADYGGARHQWLGRAVRLGGAVDEKSRLVPVVIEIEDPYRMVGDRPPLIEGLFVEVTFSAAPPAGSVVIPRSALRPGDRVWVVTPDRTISLRDVEVARTGVHEAVITGGLAAGERICTSNLQYVTEGLPVRIEGEPQPEAAAAAAPAAAKDGAR